MRVLIGVLSFSGYRRFHETARRTWLQDCPVDYVIAVGRNFGHRLEADEKAFNTEDNERMALNKTKHLIRYALDSGYEYLFKCDIDSYVHVPRLLASGFEQHEFIGYQGCYGGSGYWINRRCMGLLLSEENKCQVTRSEDSWVLSSLSEFGIQPYQDARYHSLTKEGPSPTNDLISVHWYADWKGSEETSRHIMALERLSFMEDYFKVAQEIE